MNFVVKEYYLWLKKKIEKLNNYNYRNNNIIVIQKIN